MNNNRNNNIGVGFVALALVTFVLAFGFYSLSNKREAHFEQIEAGYETGSVVNLEKTNGESKIGKVEKFAKLLITGDYVATQQDANVISQHIFDKLEKGVGLENLGALNLSRFAMIADSVNKLEKACPELQLRDSLSRGILQLPANLNELESLYQTHTNSVVNLGRGTGKISVVIYEKPMEGMFHKICRGLHIEKKKTLSGRLVKLTQYNDIKTDSLKKMSEAEKDSMLVNSVTYAQTNAKGIVIFEGLDENGFYSILPLKNGYEYGAPQGTTNGNLGTKVLKCSFTERIHTIRPFNTLTYQQLKADEVLTVRTPKEYNTEYWKYTLLFFAGWWLLWFILVFVRKKDIDQLLLPILMTLSGICLLLMYAIHNPLTDTIQGNIMAQGILIGIVLTGLFSGINFVKLFNGSFFEGNLCSYSYIGKNENKKWVVKQSFISRYAIYLLIGLFLTLLLFPFGDGPEGSDVKVNLFFFQPSEIAKYLMLVFFAAFFYYKADYYSDDVPFGERIKKSLPIFFGLGALMVLYLLLGDMGPALTLAITFILIYAIIRGDFKQMLIGTGTFLGLFLLVNAKKNWDESVIFSIVAVVWLIVWCIYGKYISKKKTFFESAIFMNLVISAFILGSSLPHVGERLQDRIDMAGSGVWDNEIQGGDQVVQGIWALVSGGWHGQGFENGSPNVVPAFHTDMVLSSVGEVFGWVGLALIIGCLAILINRSILIGRKTGHRFAFFLAFGIALVTTVQFLIIAFGSIGIIPLTGVAVPFISFGRVSMILNLAAFGVILSLSRLEGEKIEKDDIKENFDKATRPAILTVLGFTAFLLVILFNYQIIKRDDILIKPAYVTDRLGARLVEYNPRIDILIRNMDAGNIYDRNGLLLATNSKDSVAEQTKRLKEAGLSNELISGITRQLGRRRYYPFGDNMFFWTGNYNTRLLWDDGENAFGYIAERRHLAYLRGFNTQPKDTSLNKIKLDAKNYKVNRFLPKHENTTKESLSLYDYSDLIKFLKQGKNSSKLRVYNKDRKERDIQLTVDAKLQTEIQNTLREANLANYMRTSVVVLDAANGEILCSANYPLPNQPNLKAKYDDRNYRDYRDYKTTNRDLGMTWATNPGSTAKLMSSLAGFNKLGMGVIDTKYYVYQEERIHDDNGTEPCNCNVNIKEAIVRSSNVYFIKLVNDKDLYAPLAKIYCAVGLQLGTAFQTYKFYNTEVAQKDSVLVEEMRELERKGTSRYLSYAENLRKGVKPHKLNDAEYMIAWGQDPLQATPLSMARVVSAIVNKGKLVETKYVLTKELLKTLPRQQITEIANPIYTDTLKAFMEAETKNRAIKLPEYIGGKSGTPTRVIAELIKKNKNGRIIDNGERNDGWYIFFIEQNGKKPLAVAVRIELGGGSGTAYRLVADKLVDVLMKYN
ncbi:MAG: FtsW/RodA/SpoVE family cell cycle protein [Candidatus Azobacteroides sp.]|nr:FtsW/RodA/SpoVE family cell cycle protein [Candidatus Azobacteroides sp.]